MDHDLVNLKQRIVGAIVILSLAIIFVPMVFDKPHQQEVARVVQVPPIPDVKRVSIAKPTPPELKPLDYDERAKKIVPAKVASLEIEQPKQQEAQPVEHFEPKAKSQVVNKPRVSDLPPLKNIWVVQLGTFSDPKNAYRLRDRLRADGLDGHTRPLDKKSTSPLRVFTGPFTNKQEAAKMKLKIDKQYKLESLVVFMGA